MIKFSQMIPNDARSELEDPMTNEQGFLDGLQSAKRFEISGKNLMIFKGPDVLLQLKPRTIEG